MSDWIKAMNPTAPITTEAEALRAGRASAVSIFIGAAVGAINVAWTAMNPDAAANTNAAAGQAALWIAGATVVVQLVLGWVQWREPRKVIAIIFLLLIAFGVLTTLAAPMMAGMVPDMPVIPMWQIALSLVIMAIQIVLHVAGLRGIGKLDALQMDAAR
jgi:hypothetical protein